MKKFYPENSRKMILERYYDGNETEMEIREEINKQINTRLLI